MRTGYRRWISGFTALLLALQPTISVLAQTEEETTVRGEDYTIRSNWDGTKTLTFSGELEADGTLPGEVSGVLAQISEDMETESEEDLTLETYIEGSGEDTQVTMEYGDYVIEFSPEIYEEEPSADPEGTAEAVDAVKTRSEDTEAQSEANEQRAEVLPTEAKDQKSEEISAEEKEQKAEEIPVQTESTEKEIAEEAQTEGEIEADQTESEAIKAEETERVTEAEPETAGAKTGETEGAETEKAESETAAAESEEKENAGKKEAKIPDSTIRYRKLEDGVKEELVIYGYKGGHRVDYQFRFEGLTPMLEGQAIQLQNEDGALRASVSAPYLYDAAGVKCYDVEVVLQQTGEDSWTVSYIPSDEWLSDPARVYPVVLDPTIRTENSEQVEDNQAAGGSLKDTQYPYNQTYMYAGNKNGITYVAYCRPAIPDNVKTIADHIIIQSASVRIYVQEKKGSGPYTMHLVNGPWSSNTITGRNKPSISEKIYGTYKMNAGTRNLDIKELVSEWFNNLDQKENCGFALKGNGVKDDYILMSSSDDPSESQRLIFTITYKEINTEEKLGLTAAPHGNGANSGTGYVDLTWNKVKNAEGYYVAVSNGKSYEYFFVGNVTSWSTKGQGIWPTESEIGAGRYKLHHNGAGAELPCIPAFTYANVTNSKLKNNLRYYFRVVPCNEYGQAIAPDTFAAVSALLPDTIAPNQPTAVSVNPSDYSNAKNFTVSWSGIRDFTTTSETIQNNVGTGKIQYSIDGTNNWKDTDKNSASGKYAFDASACADGIHTVYIRGKDGAGNTGVPLGAQFKVDRAGPEGQTVTVLPADWTQETTLFLNVSGMKDLNAIRKIEYRIDNEGWADTGKTSGSFVGYEMDVSHLADGVHTISLRGTDSIGNAGAAVTATAYIDRSAPETAKLFLEPSGWNGEDEVTLRWENAVDATSGILRLEYALDGEWKEIEMAEASGSLVLPAQELSDGEHEITLRTTDRAGNVSKEVQTFLLRDTKKPEVTITAPSDFAILDGEADIAGEIRELHLKNWKLTARDSEGNEQILAEGEMEAGRSGEEDGEISTSLMVSASLKLSDYPDGENVTVLLHAEDEAGNVGETQITVIRIGEGMEPFEASLQLEFPELLTKAQTAGAYTLSSAEQLVVLYVDGTPSETVSGGSFLVDGVRYSEGSRHTITAIAKHSGGGLSYSQGLGAQTLLEELWEAGAPTAGRSYVSPVLRSARPMLALRLSVTDFTPGDTSISYEYSTDGGTNWIRITPGEDALLAQPAASVQIRAICIGDGEREPKLHRMNVSGVLEFSPKQFTVRIDREAERFAISGPKSADRARTVLKTNLTQKFLERAQEVRWFVDGRGYEPQGDEKKDVLDALLIPEESSGKVSGAVLNENGKLYVSGAASERLLREDAGYANGTVERKLSSGKKISALLLQAALRGGEAVFYYSEDGSNWKEIRPEQPVILKNASENVYLRAKMSSGTKLAGWQLMGYRAQEYTIKSILVKAPLQVSAADYGESEKPRYELTWRDTQGADETAGYRTSYRIYRDGQRIGETQELSFIDNDYRAGASYQVSACRIYETGAYPERESARTRAAVVKITGDRSKASVVALEHFQQSDYLTSLYGGNHTFSLADDAPAAELRINQYLLGKSHYCSIGFEPVNFNTGNFLVEAEDYRYALREGDSFSITRTYNAQSTDTDGPFGSGWSFAWGQYLQQYADGIIGWRMADGALALFENTQDGYVCDLDGHLSLRRDSEGGYTATDGEGNEWRFTELGLLSGAKADGYEITLRRITEDRETADVKTKKANAADAVTAKIGVMEEIQLPDGTVIRFETDALGHITKIIEAGGAFLTYAYEENQLVSMTDELGYTTRYVYDEKGRMTEWYDKAGNRQVHNEYDEENRVVGQIDVQGAEYTLEYLPDHTITIDGAGNHQEIWFDEKKRTTKEVDAQGQETLYSYDAEGNLAYTTDTLGRLNTSEFDETGNKTKDIAPDGSTVTMEYDEDRNLTKLTDEGGSFSTYEYDANGNVTDSVDATGASSHYEYDDLGNLILSMDALGNTCYYTYEGYRMVSRTDALGNETSYTYDAEGRQTSATDALGRTSEYTYDAAGNRIKISYPDGTGDTYAYDALGNCVRVEKEDGDAVIYEYDAFSRLVKTVLSDGRVLTREYSISGDLVRETDGYGHSTNYTYDKVGNCLTETDERGNVTATVYDEGSRLVRQKLPGGVVIDYTYDEVTGLVVRAVDSAGGDTTYTYDERGNILRQENADGSFTETEYDVAGRMVRQRNESGGEQTWEYDAAGNLVRTTNALGGVTEMAYDGAGNLISSTQMGGTTTYTYDGTNRLISMMVPDGGITTYAYDERGRVSSVKDPFGHTSRLAYNEKGRVASSIDALGQETLYEYDEEGNCTASIRPDGSRTESAYDENGNVSAETNALGERTLYEYDEYGQLIRMTDALDRITQYAYDTLGNVTKVIYPDGSDQTYAYDEVGRIAVFTDRNGLAAAYTYDAYGHLAAITQNGKTTSYEYDASGNVSRVTDAEGRSVSFRYDADGNLTETVYPDGSLEKNEYDAYGQILRTTTPSGQVTEYVYDTSGRCVCVSENGAATTYLYDQGSRCTGVTYADGESTFYEYDALGQLVKETDQTARETVYAYTSAGNLAEVTYADGSTARFTYDAAGRLATGMDGEGNITGYEYDAAGRLIRVENALGQVGSYEYDENDNLSAVTDANGNRTEYTYDVSGNLLSETDPLGNTTSYEYTKEGWLTAIVKADGKRISYV